MCTACYFAWRRGGIAILLCSRMVTHPSVSGSQTSSTQRLMTPRHALSRADAGSQTLQAAQWQALRGFFVSQAHLEAGNAQGAYALLSRVQARAAEVSTSVVAVLCTAA